MSLQDACDGRDYVAVKELIENGLPVDTNIRCNRPDSVTYCGSTCTPFWLACSDGDFDIAEYLLEKGADIAAAAACGSKVHSDISPLKIACIRGHESIIELLLDKGAVFDVNSTDGRLLFWVACFRGHLNLVKRLVHARPELLSDQWLCENDKPPKNIRYDENVWMKMCRMGKVDVFKFC
jgi:ankyrin repeat protein